MFRILPHPPFVRNPRRRSGTATGRNARSRGLPHSMPRTAEPVAEFRRDRNARDRFRGPVRRGGLRIASATKKIVERRAARDVFDDNRIVLLPLPGHTAGSIGAKLEFDRSGCFILAADAVPVRQTLERDYSPKNSRDAALFCRSLAELRRLEKQGSTILFGHDAEQWNILRKGAFAYD
jgi:glyoxylase-like metal-dependent hydrolase (beta-lactamase superfamily II)